MGFFSDLKEDIEQAYNEIKEDAAEKELLEEEERLKKELADMEEEFKVSGVESENDETDELLQYLSDEADEETQVSFEGVNGDVMAALSEGYANATENLPEEEENLVEEFEAALANLGISEEEIDELMEGETEEIIVVESDTEVDAEEVEDVLNEIEEIEEVIEMTQEEMTTIPEEEVMVSMADENAEVGFIPEGMIITGDIATSGGLDLRGTVLGNIEIGGKLNVSGSIQGNSKAVEIFAQAAKITGDVECDNSVKVGPNSVVIGNICARSAVIAGAVKGDIDVRGPVILDSSAIIKGNIKSKSVQINNGAAVEGMCSQCYADVNPSSFFEGLE